jgi:hypothetical protein
VSTAEQGRRWLLHSREPHYEEAAAAVYTSTWLTKKRDRHALGADAPHAPKTAQRCSLESADDLLFLSGRRAAPEIAPCPTTEEVTLPLHDTHHHHRGSHRAGLSAYSQVVFSASSCSSSPSTSPLTSRGPSPPPPVTLFISLEQLCDARNLLAARGQTNPMNLLLEMGVANQVLKLGAP